MPSAINTLFTELQIHAVLMDVGATGEPPALWNEIAPHSTYIGVGPASAPAAQGPFSKFQKAHTVEKIVTAVETESVSLNLMRDTIYSSLFEAHPEAIRDFLEPRLEPAGEARLPATTIDSVVSALSLPGIDWLHTNINGLDASVFKSLSGELKGRVLALDSCLDLVDLYLKQESSVARYPEIINEGFWLSRTFIDGPVRMRQESLAKLQGFDSTVDARFVSDNHRRTPGWIFVRFFRTIASLAEREAPARDYVLLWAFALLDGQFGFCADLLVAYELRFGSDQSFRAMQSETVVRLKALKPKVSLKSMSKRFLPAPLRRGLRRILGRGTSPGQA